MAVIIASESPDTPDIVSLLEAHLLFAAEHSPPEHVHALDLPGLLDPSVTFCTARLDGGLLGVGAVRDLGDGRAELKSMHTAVAARGQGVGRQMVGHLIGLARTGGANWIGLETGTMEAFVPAQRLYASIGFARSDPFGAYTVNPYSLCMSMTLEDVAP